jgi:alanine racemase
MGGFSRMTSTSRIQLNRLALENNLRYLRTVIGEKVVFSSVVKSNAYGHGIEHFVPMVEACGVDHFSVFSLDEARRVVAVCAPETRVMIMGYIDDGDLPWVIERGVEFYIFAPKRLRETLRICRGLHLRARVHLELETGLHRTGLEAAGLPEVVELLTSNADLVEVAGLCTHFAGAEVVSNYYRIQNQIREFHTLVGRLREAGVSGGLLHAACSAAIFNYPETILDMVRVGIAQYGLWSSQETRIRTLNRSAGNGITRLPDPLRRVLRWTSSVMDTKDVAEGEYVSYGYSYLASRDLRIASVPVGYAQGYKREISNQGHVLIRGARAPVVGVINMNMMLVDVTDIPEVAVGDEVVLIGMQGDFEISVSSFSDMVHNLNYETLVGLPAGTERTVVERPLPKRTLGF